MKHARDFAHDQIPPDASSEARRIAEEAVSNALYGVMMLLDGVASSSIDPEPSKHRAQYVLLSRIRDTGGNVLDTFELAPGGDELCMGLGMWMEGEFGSHLPRGGTPQPQLDTPPNGPPA